jgi:transcriptional regulator with XRE-family HTH domain
MTLGQALKKARTNKGQSLRELAKVTGLSHSFISDIEHGLSKPSIDNLVKLSVALDVKPDYFLSTLLVSNDQKAI